MYISNSNLNKILNSIALDEKSFDDLYKSDLSFCLSHPEKVFLKKSKTFFENTDRSLLIFNRIEPTTDKFIYVYEYENSSPAYHVSAECPRLNAKWVNYNLPASVRTQGKEISNKFRKIVKNHLDNGGILEDEAFILSLKIEFGIVDRSFGRLDKDNSGSVDFAVKLKMESLPYVTLALDKLNAELIAFKNISAVHSQIYEWRYFDEKKIRWLATNQNDEKRIIAMQLAELKINLMTALMESYMKEGDFDQAGIDEGLLIDLGFKKCLHCSKPIIAA